MQPQGTGSSSASAAVHHAQALKRTMYFAILTIVLTAVLFVLDVILPIGYTAGILYVIPLMTSLEMTQKHRCLLSFFIYALLIVAAIALKPPSAPLPVALFNRALALFALGFSAWLICRKSRAERDLRDSETQLNSLFLVFPAILDLLDDRFRLINVDRNIIDRYGIKKWEDAIGKPVLEMNPLPKEETEAMFRRVLQNGETFRNVESMTTNRITGKRRNWLLSYFPVPLRGGKPGIGIVGLEITDRKRAEQALLKSESELRAITENSPDIIARFDRQFRHLFINPGGEAVYGRKKEEIIGRTGAELRLPANVVELWHKRFEEVFATGEPGSIEYELGSPALGRRYFISSLVPERNDKGEPVSLLAITRDITDRKKAEEALQSSNRELEQFAYIASHDLQEPLRMVSSFTGLLEQQYKDRLDARAREYMGYITDGSLRMQQLIQDLLMFSRIGRLDQERSSVDCNRVVDAVAANMAMAVKETGAVVTHGALPVLCANATTIARLFQNLISNALKFRRKGVSPRVHIAAECEGGAWRFSVKDNGIGIDPKYFGKLFVIFQRLHSRQEYPGTGIGLAVCKKIVESYGGRIWVEAEPGEGSTFYFTLPA